MPLTLAILNAQDSPEREVDLSLESHEEIISAASSSNLQQVLRMHDYYGEHIEYTPTDATGLVDELLSLDGRVRHDTLKCIAQVVELARHAIKRGESLHVLPD